MDPHNSTADQFMNLAHSNAIIPLHNLPTRVTCDSATLLDMVFTNVWNKPCHPGIIIDNV